MYIFIDESGGFQVPNRQHWVSCVSALVVPESLAPILFRRFRKVIQPWRLPGEEVKGSRLDELQMEAVVRTICRFDVLLFSAIIDMGLHSDESITNHKNLQADKLIAPIVPGMNAHLRTDLERWSVHIRNLSNQLYVQSVILTNLLWRTFNIASLYYVQRIPKTLGSYVWRIDSKDVSVTKYEKIWTENMKPWFQSLSIAEPFVELDDANYSAFARFQKEMPEPPPHLKPLLKKAHKPFLYTDPNEIMEDIRFCASHTSTGLQIVDVLGAAIRRACNGTLQKRGWQDLGRLMPTARAGGHCVQLLALGEIAQGQLPYLPIIRLWDRQTRRLVLLP